MKKYTKLNNLFYYLKELFKFDVYGFLVSFLVVPSKVIKAFSIIYIPKVVIDTIQNNENKKDFLVTVGIITLILMFTSLMELYSKNTMEHYMNSFVLVHLNKQWVEKATSMEYSVFVSEAGKQATEKARLSLEGTTRWGIGTYVPRLLNFLTSILGFITYGTVLIMIHPLVIVALIISYLLSMFYTLSIEKKKQLEKDNIVKADRKLNYFAYKTRGMQIAKDIRIFSMKEWISDMATLARLDKKNIDKKITNYQMRVLIVNAILVFFRDGITYALLIYLTIKGSITVGEFALYSAAIIGLGDWLIQMTKGLGDFFEANNYVEDFKRFMDMPNNIHEAKRGLDIDFSEPLTIEIKNVSYIYEESQKKVLDNISIKIKAGEKIAIVGENGAGKTTFIKLICGLIYPSSGEVLINNINIREYSHDDYFKLFAVVFQDSSVLPVSIKENITMNRVEKTDDDLLKDVINKAGLTDKINSLENGVMTPLIKHITENGTELSGGEKQKLFLARALYRNSPILILDEPTAAMDPIAEQEIYMQYNEFTRNKTSFFISHRLSSTRFCDKILLLEDAKIKELGTHEELMKLDGKYAKMFRIQSKYYNDDMKGGSE